MCAKCFAMDVNSMRKGMFAWYLTDAIFDNIRDTDEEETGLSKEAIARVYTALHIEHFAEGEGERRRKFEPNATEYDLHLAHADMLRTLSVTLTIAMIILLNKMNVALIEWSLLLLFALKVYPVP